MALFVHISHKVSNRCNDRGPWVTKFSQMRYQGLPIHFQCCKQVQNTSKTCYYVVGTSYNTTLQSLPVCMQLSECVLLFTMLHNCLLEVLKGSTTTFTVE